MNQEKEQIKKLPKWAQSYIEEIERQRDTAVRELNKYLDAQTPSPFYTDDMICTGENKGPTTKKRYLQIHRLTVEYAGVSLQVLLRDGIELKWEAAPRFSSGHVAAVPTSFQTLELIAKENMR